MEALKSPRSAGAGKIDSQVVRGTSVPIHQCVYIIIGWVGRTVELVALRFEVSSPVITTCIIANIAQWEKSHGRMCLPAMLLHPIKNVVEPEAGFSSKSDLPY